MPELKNQRHELFAQNVASGMTLEKAYVASGFWAENDGSRRGAASRLAAKVIIAARISELQGEIAKQIVDEVVITAKEVLQELKKIGLSDPKDIYDSQGNVKPMDQIPEELRRAIGGYETRTEYTEEGREICTRKVKLWDKTKSLELLGRHLKLFTDKVEHSGKVALEELISGSKEENKK